MIFALALDILDTNYESRPGLTVNDGYAEKIEGVKPESLRIGERNNA